MEKVERPTIRSFNEAGAVMPRKGAWRIAPTDCGGRFNEAGAVMPRKGPASPTM